MELIQGLIWIQRNTGHDLQTFSDLTKMKSLDSRRRNFSAVKKVEDIRLPSWLMVKENDFSLIGEMTRLKQLSLHDVAIDDYSFLAGCKSLTTLDLQDTSFSDCRLLAELPALKKVLLPPYSQLKHTEVLEQLSCLLEIKEEKTEVTGVHLYSGFFLGGEAVYMTEDEEDNEKDSAPF